MELKPEFEDIVPRMEAFWRGELLDRACIAVCAPKGTPRREVPPPPTPAERRWNVDYVLESAEAAMEATYFAGEAIPHYSPNLGPDAFSAFLGAPLEHTGTSSWAKRCIETWDDPPEFVIDREGPEWTWYERAYAAAVERARGRYLLGAPDCHSGGDCLLAMRGAGDVCLDVYDHPSELAAAMRKLEKAVVEFHAAWWPLIESSGQRGHTTAWMSTWSPGRSSAIQLDLLAMISPGHLREFFFHELEVQCGALENAVFHLDGPEAIGHLPVLYELLDVRRPGSPLRAIQWVHGAGRGPMTRWVSLLREIQSNGAGLHLSCGPGEVGTLLRDLSSRGLFIQTSAKSVEEADEIVKLATRLAHD